MKLSHLLFLFLMPFLAFGDDLTESQLKSVFNLHVQNDSPGPLVFWADFALPFQSDGSTYTPDITVPSHSAIDFAFHQIPFSFVFGNVENNGFIGSSVQVIDYYVGTPGQDATYHLVGLPGPEFEGTSVYVPGTPLTFLISHQGQSGWGLYTADSVTSNNVNSAQEYIPSGGSGSGGGGAGSSGGGGGGGPGGGSDGGGNGGSSGGAGSSSDDTHIGLVAVSGTAVTFHPSKLAKPVLTAIVAALGAVALVFIVIWGLSKLRKGTTVSTGPGPKISKKAMAARKALGL